MSRKARVGFARHAWWVLCLAAVVVSIPAGSARASSAADITGTWHCCGAGGAAAQDFVITAGKGSLAGKGVLPGGQVFAVITGSVSGAHVTIVTTYTALAPGYVATFVGTLSADGRTITGSWTSNRGQSGTFTATGGTKCATSCPPTVTVSARASRVDRAKGGTVTVRGTVVTAANGKLDNARIAFEVSPEVNVKGKAQTIVLGSVPAKTSRTASARPVSVEPVVVDDGLTIAGMNSWTTNGWSAAKATASVGGGDLVYSDSPEYLAVATRTKGGAGGPSGEGVLYRQRGATRSGVRTPDFRVYLNHENRTAIPKALCLVFTGADGAAITVTPGAQGLATRFGNPVAAGKLALLAYEAARRSGVRARPIAVPAQGGAARCVTTIGSKAGFAEVANGIFDFTTSGPVQVGVVAVKGTRAKAFEADPLAFRFIDAAHPNGNPARTYETDGAMSNAGETHVSGTFPYNEVDVKLPRFRAADGKRLGVRLAGRPSDLPGEYARAVDTGQTNLGNYGVIYNVTVANDGEADQAAQVLMNPRAVGRNAAAKVTNGYAGVVDVPATSGGKKPTGKAIPTPAGDGNLTDPDLGIGLGRARGGSTFTFSFMPPGGASLPVAIVASPAFVTVKAILTWSKGRVESKPVTVQLQP